MPHPSSNSPERTLVEEGLRLRPRFGPDGLVTCVTVDASTGDVLMVAHMNAVSLARTVETREAWYWSRSRDALWRKGETSGQTQAVVSMAVDCDQDAILLRVVVGGDGGCCHTGRRSCFYREVELGGVGEGPTRLRFIDPVAIPASR